MIEKIILGGVGLFIACCFFAGFEEEAKRRRERKTELAALEKDKRKEE